MRSPAFLAALLPVLPILLAACRREAPVDEPLRDTTPVPALRAPMTTTAPESLRLELVVPQRVAADAAAPITLLARNAGAQALQLYLRGRVIAFDLVVSDASGTVVWRRLEGQAVPAIVQIKVLGPGESLEFRETWDLRTNRGRRVPPGRYTVVGLLLRDDPEPFRAAPRSLEIEPPR